MNSMYKTVIGVLIPMFIGYVGVYLSNYVATKQQLIDLSKKSDIQYIELSIQINEQSIDEYDQLIQLGMPLEVKQERRHESLIESTKELIKQRNELLGL